VRVLRVAIPAVILTIGAVIVVAATFFNRFPTAFPIDPRKVSLSGTKIVMELPRVTGFTTDQRPYEMTARAAAQDLTQLDVLELKEINAKVALQDGQHVNITSINGIYDTKAEVLKLNDHIVVTSSSGYEGHLSEATVHIPSGRIVSESPVEVHLPNNGLLNAQRMEVLDNGASVKFGGGVEMTIQPEQLRSQDQPASRPAPQDPTATAGASVQAQRRTSP
jgi:lipopolysaccharide export system protein LptC